MTRLRQMMLEELQRRNYSKSTTRYYLQAVANFARHFGKSPDKLGPDELRSYQAYLLRERKLAVGFQPFAWRERQGARGRIPSGGRYCSQEAGKPGAEQGREGARISSGCAFPHAIICSEALAVPEPWGSSERSRSAIATAVSQAESTSRARMVSSAVRFVDP